MRKEINFSSKLKSISTLVVLIIISQGCNQSATESKAETTSKLEAPEYFNLRIET